MRVVFGLGALENIAVEVDALGAQRVMLVASASARPVVKRVRALLSAEVVDVVLGVREHVPADDVEDVVPRVARARADAIIAIGGGSAIGLAKAVALQTDAVVMAVPTTYSGSEMTPIYGTTDETGKHTGRAERVRPRSVLYDPQVTISLSPTTTAASGMNALAHCVEALYAPDASPISSLVAEEGARLLVASLPLAASAPGDLEARSELLLGSFFAGWALGTTTMGLHHRICHVLGGTYGLSHGLANAVMLPYVVAFNAPVARAELAPLSDLLGADLPRELGNFVARLGLPTTLPAIGFGSGLIEEAAALVVRSSVSGPRPVTRDDVVDILKAACDRAGIT